MHIGSTMTENVSEADPKYAEVAKEYEEEVLVVDVPEGFTNFPLFNPVQGKPQYITPTFQHLFVWSLRFYLRRRIYTILSFD